MRNQIVKSEGSTSGVLWKLLEHEYTPITRYLLASAFILTALIIQLVFRDFFVRAPYFLFWPAVILAGWFGGLWPGIMTGLASTALVSYFFLPPYNQFSFKDQDLLAGILFIIITLFINFLRVRQRQTGLLLQKQAEELRVTLTSIGDGVITTDTQGRVTFLNSVAEQLTGWSSDEARGRSIDEVFRIVNEYTRQPVISPIGKVLEQGVVVGLANHTILIAKDGAEYPISDSGAPIRASDGQILGTVLVFQDGTRLRESERARQTLELVLSNIDEGFVIFDSNWNFTFANRRAGEMGFEVRGMGQQQMLERTLEQAYPELVGTNLYNKLKQAAAEKLNFYFEEYIAPYQRWYEYRIHPTDAGLGVFVTDTTSRNLFQRRIELLQQLTAEFSQAVTPEQVAEVILKKAIPTFGGHVGSVALLEDDAETLDLTYAFGVSESYQQQYQRTTIHQHLPITDAVRLKQPVWLETEEAIAQQYPHIIDIIRANTQSQAMLCLPLMSNDHLLGAIGMSFPHPRYFTDEERAFLMSLANLCAQSLQRAQLYLAEQRARLQAEEADRLKLQFLGMVSHELRTPLTSIKGFATTLLATDVEWDSESQRNFIEIINTESDKLSELVEEVLDLSRIQAGRLKIEPRPQPVTAIIERARAGLEFVTQQHPLTIDVRDDLPSVQADVERIAQVLMNLVSNSVKYSPEGAAIIISAHALDGRVQIDVDDEGIGIPVDMREVIFEAFQQGKERKKGVGLGLAICKGIVEAHGGEIRVGEKAEPGTRISFTLPLA
jgi:PAS domain S-box-containing protein